MPTADVLYTRMLPGGGLVTIECLMTEKDRARVMLRVERRSDPRRRAGHMPPVVLERSAATAEDAFLELYKVAASNVELARCLLEWRGQE